MTDSAPYEKYDWTQGQIITESDLDRLEDVAINGGNSILISETKPNITGNKIWINSNPATYLNTEIITSDDLGNIVAPLFMTTQAYHVGDYVLTNANNEIKLWQFTANHAAGAWTGTDVKQIELSNEIYELKSTVNTLKTTIGNYYIDTLYKANLNTSKVINELTFSWNGSVCHISGNSGDTYRRHTFCEQANSLPAGMAANGTYYVNFSSENVILQFYPYINGTLSSKIFDSSTDTQFTLPADTTGIFMRFHVPANITIDEYVEPLIVSFNKTISEAVDDLQENLSSLDTNINETISDIQESIYSLETKPIFAANLSSSTTAHSITFSWNGSQCHVSGNTNNGGNDSAWMVFHNEANTLPDGIEPGNTYMVNYTSDHVTLKIYAWTGSSLSSALYNSKVNGTITFPSNATGMFCRLDADYGVDIDETLEPLIFTEFGGRIINIEDEQKQYEDIFDNFDQQITSIEDELDQQITDIEDELSQQNKAFGNIFHQYNFLEYEYFTGYYDNTGTIQSSTGTWKTYIIPITNTDKYYFYNRDIALAVLDSSKNFISLLNRESVSNAIQGVDANIEAYRASIDEYPDAKYICIPRNNNNLTYLRSARLPNIIPLLPFNSDSTCDNIEIIISGKNAECNAKYRALRFINKGMMKITTGESQSNEYNYMSDFTLFKAGTTVSTKNTPYRLHFRGMNSDGAAYISATDEYTFDRDFWGTADYSDDGSWAWSTFAPQNIDLKAAQIFVSMVTPEDRANNPWLGKSWYCYGTSISDIGANDAAGNNGHSGKYPLYLDAVTGMTRTNGAIGSGGIRTNASHQGNVLTALLTTPFDVDLVTLETLPNDGVDDPANVGEITDTGTTTICGAFKTAVEYILNNTRAKFVLIFVGGYAAGTDAMNSTHMGYIDAKDKLKKIAECYGVPVIDAEKEAADWKHRKSGVLLADNIHPNYLGGFVYGKYIWQKLKQIQPNPIYPEPST